MKFMNPTAGLGGCLEEVADFAADSLVAEDVAVEADDDDAEQESDRQGDNESGKEIRFPGKGDGFRSHLT